MLTVPNNMDMKRKTPKFIVEEVHHSPVDRSDQNDDTIFSVYTTYSMPRCGPIY